MELINKPSEAIRFAITSGMYISGATRPHRTEFGLPMQFMCAAINQMSGLRGGAAVVTERCASETVQLIEDGVGSSYTLISHLVCVDKSYGALADKYSHEHRFCFKRRLKFWEKFITKLEKEGK